MLNLNNALDIVNVKSQLRFQERPVTNIFLSCLSSKLIKQKEKESVHEDQNITFIIENAGIGLSGHRIQECWTKSWTQELDRFTDSVTDIVGFTRYTTF